MRLSETEHRIHFWIDYGLTLDEAENLAKRKDSTLAEAKYLLNARVKELISLLVQETRVAMSRGKVKR